MFLRVRLWPAVPRPQLEAIIPAFSSRLDLLLASYQPNNHNRPQLHKTVSWKTSPDPDRLSCSVGDSEVPDKGWFFAPGRRRLFSCDTVGVLKKNHLFRLTFDSSVTNLLTDVLHQTINLCSCFAVSSSVHRSSQFPGDARHHFEFRMQYPV